jgi:translocation and assembly module TamB
MNHNADRDSDKQASLNNHLQGEEKNSNTVTSNSCWRKLIISITILLLAGAGSGAIYGWYLVQRKLVPLIEKEASNYLHRPLKLGELKTISPLGARFGTSSLPATNNNPDQIKTTAVKVNLAPLYFLRKRQLKIDIILIKPDVYIEQDESKLWTPTNFGSDKESDGGIEVKVTSIQLQGGKLALAAYNDQKSALNPAVTAQIDDIEIRPQGKITTFDAAAELNKGGKFKITGQGDNQTGIIDLNVTAQQLAASEMSNLIVLPIKLNQGNLNGQIGVTLTDAPIPELEGMLTLDDVSLQIPNLVKPFSGSDGTLNFQGSKIELENIKTNFGEVVGIASGSLDLAGKGNYQINTKVKPVAANKIIKALELESTVAIAGKIASNVTVTGSLEQPIIQFALATTTSTRIDKLNFQQIKADLELVGSTLSVRQFTGLPQTGGKFVGNGKLQLDGTQDLAFNLAAIGVSGEAIARSYNNQLPVDIGRISGQTQLSAQAGDLSTLRLRQGQANFTLGNGTVKVNNLDYGKGVWSSTLTTSGVEFGSLPFGEGSAPTIAKGLVDGVFKVAGTSNVGDLNQLKAKGKGDLKTVGGQIALPEVKIANGNWKTDAKIQDLKLRRLFPDLPKEFNDNLSGKFYLTGNIPDTVQPQTLINGFGDLALAQGKVKVDDLKIVDQNWTANAQGTNLKLKELSSTTPEQFAGLVNGRLKLAGTTDNITPEGIKAKGNGSLTLPEGVFAAEQLAIAKGRFQASVIPQGVALSLFADPNSDELELNGQLGGQLTVTGKVDNLSPTAVVAKGNLTFSQGIDLLEQPLGAAVTWDGKRLDILQATGDGLNAQGHIKLDKAFFSDIPDKLAAVDYFELDIPKAQWLDINKLRLTLPSWATNLDYSGRGDFSGQISGIPSAMTINGDLGLRNFRVENLNFATLLAGNVDISPKTGAKLQLQEVVNNPLDSRVADITADASPLDKIELVLDANFTPQTFAIAKRTRLRSKSEGLRGIAQDNLKVEGTGEQEILNISTYNFPVELLKTIALKSNDFKVPKNIALQPIDGQLSGDFTLNLNTLATSGENIVIDAPAIASIRGDRLQGDFQYADGYFALQDVEFKQRNSTYKLKGGLAQKPDDIAVDGQVSIQGGQVQDILIALQIFELTDFSRIFSDRAYAKAADLYKSPTVPNQSPLFQLGLKDAPVLDQLQLLSAIQASLKSIQQQRQTALIPDIKNLRGTFDGKVNVSGSVNTGLNSEFEFLGEQWEWGDLISKQIIAKGNLKNGILTLLPISLQLQDKTTEVNNLKDTTASTLVFSGIFGGETQSGQLRLVEIPVKLIEQLFSFPPELALDGLLNATATIAGTKDDSQARGEIRIDNASLNQTSIQSTKGSFNYNNSRLDFSASSIVAENADPLTITGNIPYKLPFAKVEPESDRLELQLNVKNKGLALLDIFSRGELKWIDGQGEIVLDISGILDPKQKLPRQLVAQGTATIENAVIAAKSLPKNLITNIESQIFFDLDNVRVNNFQGDFGGGQILAAGTVPFRGDNANNPLTIDFDNIKEIELPELYDGGLQGRLQILGNATEPILAGDVTLFDGTVFLDNETDATEITTANSTDNQINSIIRREANNEGLAAVTQYKNFKLQLGKDIQISQPPLFTFLATGALNVNGTFLEPSPEGTITLQRGQVNLFTTQLNLSRDYQNTARFSSNNVLDPFLDVLLVGSALETTERNIPSEVLPSEIPASSLGTLETVRIAAKVKGQASQITNKIELTSSPPRSQAEILALLGGGFVETLANSNGTVGLATLAGSALFGSLNAEFNNTFPIGELRLFPTPIIDENRDSDRNDGIAGEIAFDLIDGFSFSVLKILNTDIPAQFGFRYRLNNNFVLRGSSNFEKNGSRALIEFESRF